MMERPVTQDSGQSLIRDQSLTAHTYDRALAERVHEKLPAHYEAMRGLAEALSRTA